jgi:hypothetical protein
LSNATRGSANSQIAADTQGNNVYLTWVDIDTSNGQKQVFFRASNDNGQIFGSRIMLNSTTTGPKETKVLRRTG